MNGAVVLGAVLALAAGWLWVPDPAVRRLRSTGARELPRWVQAPGAMPLRKRVVLGMCLGLGVTSALGGWWLLVAPVIAAVVALVLGQLEPSGVQREREARVRGLPQVLELLSCALSAGQPLRAATRTVAGTLEGPLEADLRRVLSCLQVGMSESQAWQQLGTDPSWRLAVRDISRSAASGTGLAECLNAHAEQARRGRSALLHQRARTLGVRSVFPMMVCFLPAFVLVGLVPIVGSLVSGFVGRFG